MPPERLIVCSQNHDQVGNRALGDRPAREELRLRAAVTLFAPQIPLLFMGEEYGERAPFQFFTDHIDPEIARGHPRRAGAGSSQRSPRSRARKCPTRRHPRPVQRSKLDTRRRPGPASLLRRLLALRRRLPREIATTADEERRVLRVRRGEVELVADFENLTVDLRPCR